MYQHYQNLAMGDALGTQEDSQQAPSPIRTAHAFHLHLFAYIHPGRARNDARVAPSVRSFAPFRFCFFPRLGRQLNNVQTTTTMLRGGFHDAGHAVLRRGAILRRQRGTSSHCSLPQARSQPSFLPLSRGFVSPTCHAWASRPLVCAPRVLSRSDHAKFDHSKGENCSRNCAPHLIKKLCQ